MHTTTPITINNDTLYMKWQVNEPMTQQRIPAESRDLGPGDGVGLGDEDVEEAAQHALAAHAPRVLDEVQLDRAQVALHLGAGDLRQRGERDLVRAAALAYAVPRGLAAAGGEQTGI